MSPRRAAAARLAAGMARGSHAPVVGGGVAAVRDGTFHSPKSGSLRGVTPPEEHGAHPTGIAGWCQSMTVKMRSAALPTTQEAMALVHQRSLFMTSTGMGGEYESPGAAEVVGPLPRGFFRKLPIC